LQNNQRLGLGGYEGGIGKVSSEGIFVKT